MTIKHKLEQFDIPEHFDSTKKIREEDITSILEAMSMTPSPFALQPYRFVVVHNEEVKKDLAKYSSQDIDLSEASHLIVIATLKKISPEYLFQDVPGQQREQERKYFEFIENQQEREVSLWAQKQAYLAMGTLIFAATDLKIDVYPMEVFDGSAYNSILGLDNNLHACIVGVLGYRKDNHKNHFYQKNHAKLENMVTLKY